MKIKSNLILSLGIFFQVLGELIERLHENEEYPTFLEEILEFVANLILSIYEGKDDENNMVRFFRPLKS